MNKKNLIELQNLLCKIDSGCQTNLFKVEHSQEHIDKKIKEAMRAAHKAYDIITKELRKHAD